jgi:dipeptidyl aminopeptidase/acylaminoacyl peptidase
VKQYVRSVMGVVASSLLGSAALFGQIRVVAVEPLPVDPAQGWTMPQWSPDGKAVFFTDAGFNGIWRYGFADHSMTTVTRDGGSGYGYRINEEGTVVSYRRTLTGPRTVPRVQEAVEREWSSGRETVTESGSDVSIHPFLAAPSSAPSGGSIQEGTPPPTLLGPTDDGIALLRAGVQTVIRPLKHGHYIWCDLAPRGNRLVAYDMDRGTFTCDLDGTDLVFLGRRDGAVWTRSGRWLIYMKDVDDGERLVSSSICYVSPDGVVSGTLTSPSSMTALYPRCSPTEDKIVFATAGGEILVMTFEERP